MTFLEDIFPLLHPVDCDSARPAGYLCRSTGLTPPMCIYARQLQRTVWMTIYAVMKTGGKEYRVAPGDVVRVEKLEAAPGATVEIREVRLIEDGQEATVGSPTVANASVVAEVIEEGRGEKIVSFKKKRRSRYQMTIDELQSYTTLRIREIAVGESVYTAAAPRRDVAAAAAPPPSPPRISKPERKIPQPQAKKPLQLPTPPAPPPPAPVELPPVAAQDDAPIAPKVASEERVGAHAPESPPSAPSSTETPPTRVTPPPRVEAAAPALALDERGPRKRSHGIAAVAVALLVTAAALLVWGSRQPGAPVEAATVAASPQAAPPSVAQPAAKAPPRKETAIKKPAVASAPSAPAQPPE
jgi:large subunit ribosomal protein L21